MGFNICCYCLLGLFVLLFVGGMGGFNMWGVPKDFSETQKNNPMTRNDEKSNFRKLLRKPGNPRMSLTPVIHHPLGIFLGMAAAHTWDGEAYPRHLQDAATNDTRSVFIK